MNQKNLYRQILDNLGNAVLLFDRGLRLRFLNPAGEMLLDTSAVKALGQPATALFGSLGQHLARNLGTTLQTGAPLVERQLPLQQGERTRTVHCAITPMFEGDTVAAAIVEIEPVENYSHLSRDHQAQHQQAAVNQLLRGLAHEIKNPLGGLRGAAQLLAQELDTPQLREYTDVILQEADRLGALIDRLLAPHRPPRTQPLNIHQVLERVRQLLAAEYPALVFRCDYDPSLPLLEGDFDQLIQVFLNLVRNAAQAVAGEGEVKLRTRIEHRLTIRGRMHRLVLRVDIADNGPGIPAELGERIFYPMTTGKAEGTGLGLSIAQALVTRHGGLIEYRSRPGDTCFSVYLPLEDSSREP